MKVNPLAIAVYLIFLDCYLASATLFFRATLYRNPPYLLVVCKAARILEAVPKALQHIINIHQAGIAGIQINIEFHGIVPEACVAALAPYMSYCFLKLYTPLGNVSALTRG
jgi:hypothetical protein